MSERVLYLLPEILKNTLWSNKGYNMYSHTHTHIYSVNNETQDFEMFNTILLSLGFIDN